jgi:outer membrane protein assembly factor BamD
MKRTLLLLSLLGLVLAGVACRSSTPKEDPILKLSAEESLATGKELLAKNKRYARARPYFTHAFEVEPNSAIGREGLLLAADTFYLEGSSANYVQAEAKYRDFLNRFPTSEQAPYVQFQIANSLAKRMERPDRDQTVTRKALEAYQELLHQYPTSEYAARAQAQINVVRANLAEHEFVVGRFYLRYGEPGAAAQRFEYLLEQHPEYPERDKVIYLLGTAYRQTRQPEKAEKAFERLRTEFPKSRYVRDIPDLKLRPEAKTETKAEKAG